MFGAEFSSLADEIANSTFRDDTKSVVFRVLNALNDLDIIEDRNPRRPTDAHHVIGVAIEHLHVTLARHNELEVISWVLNAVEEILNVSPTDAEEHAAFKQVLTAASDAGRHANMLRDLYAYRAEAEAALTEAQAAAGKAQVAAGIAGGASLSDHFRDYAKSERRAAEVFRGLSIAAILATILAALAVEHPAAGDWVGFTYRVAILAGVGALSAYFARQASHHRRAYNWAKGLEVQLKSFPAFIDPADSEVKADIYRDFARRVLGAPPESSKEGGEDSLPTAQLIEALIALAKRSS
ncbi:hypothetical protein E5344_12165 [Microbacterium laevaniformans]|uniref:Uncharacterized protein n=1 Tax=Microbacterium laevaniformans TaxID=36807 RepID=A0A4S2D3A4_9MICO|nr:hypothetical protein [Microbacterium laevaniformans]TGY35033.1 hypothetical protein E5344_12165 [Microbacterium laevaniformans]